MTNNNEILIENSDDETKLVINEDIEEDSEEENSPDVPVVHYDITSYGIDYDVEGLVKRLKREAIVIPGYQRKFVWNLPESSKFIESLLLGLPVPGIFLAQESDTGKMNVIDGQQRLLSLLYFFEGYFKPIKDSKSNRVFALNKVQKPYDGQRYIDLSPADREDLNNCVIHATVVKQDSPENDNTSMFHIFGRLNSGGRRLTPQEIRTAVYHGTLIDNLKRTNENKIWRKIFGPENDRMKDQELILRFFAMYETSSTYKKPMSEFLNLYSKKNQHRPVEEWKILSDLFINAISQFATAIPEKLFRPVRGFNIAVFESCTVGLAKAIASGFLHTPERLNELYGELFRTEDFKKYIYASTSDVSVTTDRLKIATEIFSKN